MYSVLVTTTMTTVIAHSALCDMHATNVQHMLMCGKGAHVHELNGCSDVQFSNLKSTSLD